MKLTKSMIAIPIAAFLLTGCATPQRSEYAAFAQAGSGYAQAINNLLVAAGQAQVDSTSWRLVEFNRKFPVPDEEYQKETDVDAHRLTVIRELRSHAQELAKYFGELNSLAISDAPDRTRTSIDSVVKNLTTHSSALRASIPEAFSSLPPLAKIVVDIRIKKILRDELKNDLIRNELQVQQVVLNALESQIAHALGLSKTIRERQVVLKPLQTGVPLAKPEEWVKKRRDVVYLQEQVAELATARQLADKMSKTFKALLSGEEDTITKINALLNDIESLLTVTDAITS